MPPRPSSKAEAWALFDRIVADAAPDGIHGNPWTVGDEGAPGFEPDYATLERLLGVPLHLGAASQTGVPALALDVWVSHELRRAGFEADRVWPRPSSPRILPAPVAALIQALPGNLGRQVAERVARKTSIPGVTASAAPILGKNYLKQVDVIIADWATGPELLVSTKRMDSSYGKNAPNRVEESYGDAKNLRLRHPLAALGFVFGLRSDILQKEPNTAEWLFDLLVKLGQEDDAYHATCLILMDYADEVAIPEPDGVPPGNGIPEPGRGAVPEGEDVPAEIPVAAIERVVADLPRVAVRRDLTPAALSPGRFLATIATRVLAATPVNMHVEARRRRREAVEP
ncbi:hypothetical protein [Methylobacterium sp. D54C]